MRKRWTVKNRNRKKTNVFWIFRRCKTPDLSKSVMWWRWWEYLDWLQLVRVLHHATLSSCRAATCGAMHLGRQKMETVHGHNSQFSNMAPNTSYPQECLLGRGRSLTAAECVTCPASAACVSLHCAAPIADIMQHSDILLLQLYYSSTANNISETFLTKQNAIKIHILTSFV